MAVTLRQLEVFSAVARYGSMGRAAIHLGLSQPALSMALSQLETALGERVFDRVHRRLILNDRGRALLPLAAELCTRAAEIEKLAHVRASEPAGILRLGASSTIGNYVLPMIIGDFLSRHPHAQVSLEVSNTRNVIQNLLAFEIDLGFAEGVSTEPDVHSFPWRTDRLCVITNPYYPLAMRRQVEPQDLVHEPRWILREKGSGTRAIFENAIAAHVHDIHIYLELGHTESIKTAVAHGLGASCLPMVAVRTLLDDGHLVEIGTPFLNLERHFRILVHRKKYRSRLFNSFLAHCERYGKDGP